MENLSEIKEKIESKESKWIISARTRENNFYYNIKGNSVHYERIPSKDFSYFINLRINSLTSQGLSNLAREFNLPYKEEKIEANY